MGAVVIVHGAIHLLGAAKGLGWAVVPPLGRPIGPVLGGGWLVAAVLTITAGALLLASAGWWWMVGAPAVLVSEAVILFDWSDAAFGTFANVLIAAAVTYAYAAHGPYSFEREYQRRAGDALRTSIGPSGAAPGDEGLILTEVALEALPAPVARYIRQSGGVGKPQIGSFRATIHGKIRSGPGKPWMRFTGEQVNTCGPVPDRFFKMDASMARLPVDVLHVFAGEAATMRVKLCSLLPMVNASGPEMARAETVTLLNDMCVMAPPALATASITWTLLDDHRVRATFTRRGHKVNADLVFNDQDQLVDFISDDRYAASPDGKTFRRQRWSTPLRGYRSFHGHTISASAQACWHTPEPEGQFAYLEFRVDEITYQAAG
ncbi:MAG: hypothetical protein QOD41_1117 [Cryptosporangiaceae bacterium]|nr:hypothetical protein [Cryptosporangiaceae bacterium]